MSYVLHVYRMTYKTYDMQEYIFVHSEEWYSWHPFFGIYLFYPSALRKRTVPWSFAPPATERTTAVFSMVLDLFFPKHCVHKDTARYVLSNSKPFGLLSKILVLIWKICFEITHLLNMSYKLGHLSRIFAVEINKI